MTRDEVRGLMYEYFDGYLSDEECSRVRSFLEEYEDVAEEYRRFHKILNKVGQLPSGIAVPDNLVSQISDELLSLSNAGNETGKLAQKEDKVKRETDVRKNKHLSLVKIFWILVVVMLAVAAAFLVYGAE